jgi:hypothetical protein
MKARLLIWPLAAMSGSGTSGTATSASCAAQPPVSPLPDQANKILWVPKTTWGTPLVIHATLADSTRTATVTLPNGPGPSHVDMPAPGCWTLRLSWAGHTDQLSLRYAPG